jgi:hypothetical protein
MKYFLGTAVTEVLNFAVSKQALLNIASQMEQPGEYEIWVDSREENTMLSTVNVDRLGEMLAAHPSLRESGIALATTTNQTEQADVLETITFDRAFDAKVIAGFDNAIA